MNTATSWFLTESEVEQMTGYKQAAAQPEPVAHDDSDIPF